MKQQPDPTPTVSDRLTLDSILRRNDALLSTNLGDDLVMMDVEQGSYYGLEAVAAHIWALMEQPTSVGSLCERLAMEYDISPEQCRQEVVAFLGELLNEKMVQIVIYPRPENISKEDHNAADSTAA